ncbi:adenosylmethionine-8-amino-7-oxononanoate aminotransferase [Paraburkholderia sp. GAS32]
MPAVDHLPHTLNIKEAAFSKGQPVWRAHLADELERLVTLHDASTIAAVIVEPVAGSTGVLIPPQGYLQRLREICDKHGILLIFDEVITGWGRLGTPFAAQYFGVTPDLLTMAKGTSNAAAPMGAVAARALVRARSPHRETLAAPIAPHCAESYRDRQQPGLRARASDAHGFASRPPQRSES